MAASKYIDRICLAVLLAVFLLTAWFLNGEALGIAPVADGDAGDGQFTENDLNADWDTSGAARITLSSDRVGIEGSGAFAAEDGVHIACAGKYILTGELKNGSVTVDADSGDKIWILLDGASLYCESSAAFRIEQAGKVFLTLAEGTENAISSGAEYDENARSSGIDGALYSRDDVTINGSGSLEVTAGYQHGIVCNDDFVVAGGTLRITAAQDGIHANDSARFARMDLTVRAGDDGITVSNDDGSDYVYIESGSIAIPSCYEGIEASDVRIVGGMLDIHPEDDGINANSADSSSEIHITGGEITIVNENGRDADGLDSNGSIYIDGGRTFISVSDSGGNCALDYGSENGGVCELNGGLVIACGGSALAESVTSSTDQGFLMHRTTSTSAGTTVTLKDSEGTELLSEEIPCPFSLLVLSAPELRTGETCTLSVGDAEETVTIGEAVEAGSFGGMRGGMRGRPDGMQMPDGMQADGSVPAKLDGMQMPDGMQAADAMSAKPEGEQAADAMPAEPEGEQAAGDMFTGLGRQQADGGRPNGMQNSPAKMSADQNASTVPPEAMPLVGLSVLFLLAGLLFAMKVRQK